MWVQIKSYQDIPVDDSNFSLIWNPALEACPDFVAERLARQKMEPVCLVLFENEGKKRRMMEKGKRWLHPAVAEGGNASSSGQGTEPPDRSKSAPASRKTSAEAADSPPLPPCSEARKAMRNGRMRQLRAAFESEPDMDMEAWPALEQFLNGLDEGHLNLIYSRVISCGETLNKGLDPSDAPFGESSRKLEQEAR